MKTNRWKRGAAVILSLAVVLTGMQSSPGNGKQVQAAQDMAEGTRSSICLGTSQMITPGSKENEWTGDYVCFGNYGGTPIRWRVLDAAGTGGSSSVTGGILLQSDSIVAARAFDDGEKENASAAGNEWSSSDIREWLQGDAPSQFMNTANFTEEEKAAVMTVTKAAEPSTSAMLRSAALEKDTMFLLDISDIQNSSYGYRCEDGFLTNGGFENAWWLRSAYENEKFGDIAGNFAGSVLPGGYVFFNIVSDEESGVVPACNLSKEKILFCSAADWAKSDSLEEVEPANASEWKLTLSEGQTLTAGEEISRFGGAVTVPYTYTGTRAGQISVMITDGEMTSGETEITHYGKVSDDTFEKNGTVTFTLPEDFDETSDHVYLLAEQVSGQKQTDYASEPVEILLPPGHEHEWKWEYDEEAHWHVCTAEGCDLSPEEKTDYEEHDFGENEGILIREATPEEDGAELILCDICGNMIEQPVPFDDPDEEDPDEEDPDEEDPDEHEHVYAEQILQPATCTQTGMKRIFCTVEGCQESSDVVIPAKSASLTHTFGEWKQTVPPTTEQEGQSVRTCTVCGATETGNVPKLPPAHSHDYRENVWFMNSTSHWNQCECGRKKNEEEHTWNRGRILKAATDKHQGEIQYTCTACGYTVRRVTEKTGTIFTSGRYRYRVINRKKERPSVRLLGFAKGKSTDKVKIPDSVTRRGVSYPVTSVADKAFAGEKKIRTVEIGDQVQKIGNFAFFGAENVTILTIGKGVKTLGMHVFCHMKSVKRIWVYSAQLQATEGEILHDINSDCMIICGAHGANRVTVAKARFYAREVFHYSRVNTCK